MAEKHEETYREFKGAVNMTAGQLEKFLETEKSKSVGWHADGQEEAVGHQSGRMIVDILRKPKSELSDDDYHQMGRVVSYVHRHMAQGGPAEDKEHSRWRYSLMNWGHDPLKG